MKNKSLLTLVYFFLPVVFLILSCSKAEHSDHASLEVQKSQQEVIESNYASLVSAMTEGTIDLTENELIVLKNAQTNINVEDLLAKTSDGEARCCCKYVNDQNCLPQILVSICTSSGFACDDEK